MKGRRNGDQKTLYTIRVQGKIEQEGPGWLPGLEVIPERDDVTCLRGIIANQGALYGVLQEILHRGLPLLLVWQEEHLCAAGQ